MTLGAPLSKHYFWCSERFLSDAIKAVIFSPQEKINLWPQTYMRSPCLISHFLSWALQWHQLLYLGSTLHTELLSAVHSLSEASAYDACNSHRSPGPQLLSPPVSPLLPVHVSDVPASDSQKVSFCNIFNHIVHSRAEISTAQTSHSAITAFKRSVKGSRRKCSLYRGTNKGT